jgi:hypothetical protein
VQAGSSIVAVPLTGTAVAIVATLVVLVPVARPWRGRAARTPGWAAPLALGLAVAATFLATRSPPTLPPSETLHWILYLALLSAAFGACEARASARSWFARGLFAVLLPVVLLDFQRRNQWGQVEGILWTAGLAGFVFLAWQALLAYARRGSGGTATLGWALAAALAAGTHGLAGGSLFFLLPAALALATGACALLGLWRAEPGLGRGGLAPFLLLHFAFLWISRYLNSLTALGFVLLSLAPLAVWISVLVPATRLRTRAVLEFLGPTLVAAVALAHEFAAAAPSSPYD